ncbi:hypothetical protein [uncultured Erythrobacter sp.]|uniref:hypothetical protein n=1 Tax=uncultured Erythrobacter sp. TaxID=263913 RepID=UPI0026235F7F|nr:hypothetical protein [uncultured Erythrobacter sp.]
MKRALAIAICLVFLVSGLIRIGAGILMIGQAEGWWIADGEAVEALADTRRFFAEAKVNLVGFSPTAYFGYILFMGLTISLGAIGQIWRKHWGLILIWVYVLSHGALFVNFWTVNPKIFVWAGSVMATLVLIWANRKPAEDSQP